MKAVIMMTKKLDYITEEAKNLIDKYCDTLKISRCDAEKIFLKNKSAYTFLKGKSGLSLFNENENLGILIKLTLFRMSIDDFSPIKPEEIDIVKEYYKFELSNSNDVKEYSNQTDAECYY